MSFVAINAIELTDISIGSINSIFGAHLVRGEWGSGASGKIIVFGLLKWEGKEDIESFLIAPKPRCKVLI